MTEATPRPAVAAFDVDGTLTTRDCVTPFLREVAGKALALTLVRQLPATLAALAHRDNNRLKEIACRSLRGLAAADIDKAGARYAERVSTGWLRADTVHRLDRHRELGHRVVLVSASLTPYLEPLGARLGVDAVLCTRLEVDPNGLLTGRLDGPNCRGPEKVARLDAWLARVGLGDAEVWAYGDSAGDRELLTRADHASLVGSEPIPPDVP